MSTDRELLELAAKAAQLPECGWMGPAFMYVKDNAFTEWNPLTDGDDALRLAVQLKIAIFPPENDEGDFAVASIAEGVLSDDGDAWIQEWVKGGDKLAATRRAIVRAAAEIGRSMQ